MAFLLLLPLLVSGFLVCLKDPTIYYRLHRYEGQMLYLQVGRYGIGCFLMAFAIMSILSLSFSHLWGNFCPIPWGSEAPQVTQAASAGKTCFHVDTDFLKVLGERIEASGAVAAGSGQLAIFALLTGALTLLMPSLWAALVIRHLRKELGTNDLEQIIAYILKESVSHSPIRSTLYQSFVFKTPVMVSMDDRKVYVGYIKSLGGPTEVTGVDQEIQLLPLVSGYRDKDTLKVEYTTEYPSDATIEPVCFKQENITSIGFFSAEIRAAFQTSESQVDSKAGKFAEHLDTFLEKLIKAIKAN